MRFRYVLLTLDIVTVLFIVATSFVPRTRLVETLDVVFGLWILADFSARLVISRQPLQEFNCAIAPALIGRASDIRFRFESAGIADARGVRCRRISMRFGGVRFGHDDAIPGHPGRMPGCDLPSFS